jgi:predicted alpha/beta hydrolase family esterase
MEKQQILVIHGGEVFNSYDEYLSFLKNYKIDLEKIKSGGWKDYLQDELGENYEVIYPQMPSKHNAKYIEWKLWFENFFPFLKDDLILVGSSLGGMFLAKYLSENIFPIKIRAIFFLAAPFDDLGDFNLPESLEKLNNQAEKIFLFHSKDDPVVPFVDQEKYATRLAKSKKVIFENKGHFNLKTFPEFIEKIKSL